MSAVVTRAAQHVRRSRKDDVGRVLGVATARAAFQARAKTLRIRRPYLTDFRRSSDVDSSVRKSSVSGTPGTRLGRVDQQQGQGSRIEGDDIANLANATRNR
jgi:ribosomal protein L19E